MEKAVVVGGANGIGLSIVNKLLQRGVFVFVVDKNPPDRKEIADADYKYVYTDLREYNFSLFEELAAESDVKYLIITAGFGRVATFENLHPMEIKEIFEVNTIGVIEIIKAYYGKINSQNDFYCTVLASIAGLMSSPLLSCYAASKAALCRFIESVNIELEQAGRGCKNRILSVCPAALKGTRFNGGHNDLSLVDDLAETILEKMCKREECYIPQYDEIYKSVLERYHRDSHEYGVHSFRYKMASGRVTEKSNIKIGYLSGAFDLFSVKYFELFKEARAHCDYLIVGIRKDILNERNDNVISYDERIKVLEACKYIDKVVEDSNEDRVAVLKYNASILFVYSDCETSKCINGDEKFFAGNGIEVVNLTNC